MRTSVVESPFEGDIVDVGTRFVVNLIVVVGTHFATNHHIEAVGEELARELEGVVGAFRPIVAYRLVKPHADIHHSGEGIACNLVDFFFQKPIEGIACHKAFTVGAREVHARSEHADSELVAVLG